MKNIPLAVKLVSHIANEDIHEIAELSQYANCILEYVETEEHQFVGPITPLEISCLLGKLEVVRTLTDSGFVEYENSNAVHYAILGKKVEILKCLDNKGFDLEQYDRYRWRPIHVAAYCGALDCMEYLISRNVDLDATTDEDQKFCALHLAAEFGDLQICKSLLKANASPCVTCGNNNETPLRIACRFGYEQIICAFRCGLHSHEDDCNPVDVCIAHAHYETAKKLLEEQGEILSDLTSQKWMSHCLRITRLGGSNVPKLQHIIASSLQNDYDLSTCFPRDNNLVYSFEDMTFPSGTAKKCNGCGRTAYGMLFRCTYVMGTVTVTVHFCSLKCRR